MPTVKFIKSIKEVYNSTDYPSESYSGEYVLEYDGVGRLTEIKFYEAGSSNDPGSLKLTYGTNTVSMEMISYWEDDEELPGIMGALPSKSVANHKKRPTLLRALNPSTKAEGDNYYKVNATVTLNSDGYAVTGKAVEYEVESGDASIWQSDWIATYDNGYLKNISYKWTDPDDGYEDTSLYTCTWSNGNMTSVKLDEYLSSVAQYNTSYANSDIMNLDINWFAYDDETYHFLDEYQFFNIMGLYGKRSANLVVSTVETYGSSKYTMNYTYKFDSEGCVTELVQKSSSGGSTTTFTFSYK